MLENLTIVVITYERYDYLKRLLNFYLSYNSDAKILVLDSSAFDPEDEELLEILSHEKVSWKRFSPETFFLRKIAEGSSYIDTDFSVLSADDDFLIPKGLEECRQFLEENLDYSSAQGLSFIHFRNNLNKNKIRLESLYQDKDYALDDDSSFDRLKKYLNGESKNYPFYAVHRSKDFISIWTYARQYVDHQGLSELIPCCLSLVLGKMKVMDNFYNLREPNNFSNWDDEKTQAKVFSKQRVSKAIEGLTKFINLKDHQNEAEVRLFCENIFNIYLKKNSEKLKKLRISNSVSQTYLGKLRKKFKLRAKLNELLSFFLYKGSHPLIFKGYLHDFKKVEKSIINSNLSSEELNKSRSKVEYRDT